ncbi:hypothetical protein ABT075_09105 [Streptomyces sp. NPDC002677]|uniref:hypothetical protein n=1 Tax=Streptomyces sp. NPDC002677 TaxID=3154774 RepID=UPI00331C224C
MGEVYLAEARGGLRLAVKVVRAEHAEDRTFRARLAIGVEDLAVKGLARSRLAKSVHDAGWAAFVRMLEDQAARYGRTLVRIGRFELTSPCCSAAGPAR